MPIARGGAVDVAIDESHVYWTDWNAGRVARTPKRGGPTLAVASRRSFAFASPVAVDRDHIYWVAEDPSGGMMTSALQKADKTGGVPMTIAPAQPSLGGIALDDDHVYFTSFFGSAVRVVAKAGGPIRDLATGQSGAFGIALAGETVYWTNKHAGTVMAASKSAAAPREVVTGQREPYALAVDDERVYWSTAGIEGTIACARRDGGPVVVLATQQDGPARLVQRGAYVYWSTLAGLHRVAKSGGLVETLARASHVPPRARQLPQLGELSPRGLAVDEEAVFFADLAGSGRVQRIDLEPAS